MRRPGSPEHVSAAPADVGLGLLLVAYLPVAVRIFRYGSIQYTSKVALTSAHLGTVSGVPTPSSRATSPIAAHSDSC